MVVQLIAKDKNEKLQFQGSCRLRIDSVSKILLVEPKIEEFKMISAMFKWKFVAEKNILFVFAEHDFQDFALIFDNSKICNKVFNVLLEKEAIRGEQNLILQHFLPPFFDEISKNNGTKFKEILVDFIKKHGEKEEYIQLLKDNNVFDLCYPEAQNTKRRNFRKRKAEDITNVNQSNDGNMLSDDNENNPSSKSYSSVSDRSFIKKRKVQFKAKEIIEAPFFEIFKYTKTNILRPRLLLFPSSDRKYCYKFFWSKGCKYYFCSCCPWRNNVFAIVRQSVDGKDVVKLSKNKDGCKLREFNQEKYKDDIIVNKSMYTFVTLKSRRNVTKKYLIIFTTEKKDYCYKFFYDNHRKRYQCSKCYSLNTRIRLSATIQNEGKENEIVYLKNRKHICESLKYSDLLRASDRKIVMAPNFQLIKRKIHGKIIQKMVMFSNDEKSECFEYTWHKSNECFHCYACRKYHNIHVSAKIIKNDGTEEECVKLGRTEHKCKPIKFVSEEDFITASNRKIVMAPNYQLIKRKTNGKIIQHLAVYTNDEKRECFEYTWSEQVKYFICNTCSNHHKIHVSAKIIKNDETKEECVKLGPNEHKCKPIKFVPEDITSKIVKEPNFKLWETFYGKKKVPKLTIFDSKNINFGYVYTYDASKNIYSCTECRKKNRFISAKVLQDENGQNYVEMGKNEHVCESLEFSVLIKRCNRQIILAPSYRMIKRKYGNKIIQRLAVFSNDEKSECFEYTWCERKKYFICYACINNHKIHVSAKIIKNDETEEECVKLGQNEHKCKPIKFVLEDDTVKIVKESDFKLWETVCGKKKVPKLTIYDSKNKNFGYVYSSNASKNKYNCMECSKKNKTISAKLLQDENGQNYVEMGKTEHVCKLQKL